MTCREIRLIPKVKTFAYILTALAVGELVKDEDFTLFESIGAIEVRLCPSNMCAPD